MFGKWWRSHPRRLRGRGPRDLRRDSLSAPPKVREGRSFTSVEERPARVPNQPPQAAQGGVQAGEGHSGVVAFALVVGTAKSMSPTVPGVEKPP